MNGPRPSHRNAASRLNSRSCWATAPAFSVPNPAAVVAGQLLPAQALGLLHPEDVPAGTIEGGLDAAASAQSPS